LDLDLLAAPIKGALRARLSRVLPSAGPAIDVAARARGRAHREDGARPGSHAVVHARRRCGARLDELPDRQPPLEAPDERGRDGLVRPLAP